MNKEQELGLAASRKKFDIREEYFVRPFSSCDSCRIAHTSSARQRLSVAAVEEWEPKRIARPKGLPEWGVPPQEPPNPSKQDKA